MPVDPAVAALAKVRAYCRWIIAPSADETLTLDGSGSALLTLPSLYVNSVASVVEDGVTLVADTDYTWTRDGLLRRQTSTWGAAQSWSLKPRSVVVALNHGYAQMPDDVQEIVERIAGRTDSGAVRQVGQVAYATTSQGVGVGTALTDFDKAQLAPYRIPLAP